MSLIRPRWLDDIIKIHPSASPRVRGLKGFEPHHVPALQDPLYADDPTFWIIVNSLTGVALNFGHIGVQTPADDSFVTIVDGVSVAGFVAEQFSVDVVTGGQILLALATDTQVLKLNRREQSRSTAVEKAGLLRIADNTNAFTGTNIAQILRPASDSKDLHLGYRLFGGEQLFVRNNNANIAINATLWGRTTTKGQR